MSPCDMCGDPVERKHTQRVVALDVCNTCSRGDLIARMEQRHRWTIQVTAWTRTVRTNNQNTTYYHTRFEVSAPEAITAHVSFSRLGWWDRVVHIFKKPYTVGDPLFDERVVLKLGADLPSRAVAGHDGVQSAILELLGDVPLVTLTSGQLSCERVLQEDRAPDGLFLEVAALTRHLERINRKTRPQVSGPSMGAW